jgi:hypothetical protein
VTRIYEGRPFVYDRTGLVDGDIVLSCNDNEADDIILTVRHVLDGDGPHPLTLAARRLVRWVKTWRPMYFGLTEDNEDGDMPYNYDFVDDEGCPCRACRMFGRGPRPAPTSASYIINPDEFLIAV